MSTFDCNSSIAILLQCFTRPFGMWLDKLSFNQSSSRTLNDIDRMSRINIVSIIGSFFHGFTFKQRPASLIIMLMTCLDNIHLVFID